MVTYYVRHTLKLDIDDATRQHIWDTRRIALHFPLDKNGGLPGPDNSSLKPDDYYKSGKRAMRVLKELETNGGYVCAEYANFPNALVGVVQPSSAITLIEGKWGNGNKLAGRTAILKTLQLQRVQELAPSRSAVILVGRPRMGTIMRWPTIGSAVKNLVEGIAPTGEVRDLLPSQQETLCVEFLRTPAAAELGLPRLAHQLLPTGRTMRDVDIYGLATDGKRLIAQVTFSPLDDCEWKLKPLRKFDDASKPHLILFCSANAGLVDAIRKVDGITIVPMEKVLAEFRETDFGKQWLAFANHATGTPSTTAG